MLFLFLLADHISPFPIAVFAYLAMFALSASHISLFCVSVTVVLGFFNQKSFSLCFAALLSNV